MSHVAATTRKMAEQPAEEEAKEDVPKPAGHPWESLEDPKEARQFECSNCKLLARDACEMTCDIHDEDDSNNDVTFCEACIVSLLASNGNKCPISNHPNPKYDKLRRARKTIGNLGARCPSSVALAKKQAG